MTDYWRTIKERLHEESALHYPLNAMAQILNSYFNGILNKFEEENREFVDQGFLITTGGYFLDARGAELGLPRKEGNYATGQVTFMFVDEIASTATPIRIEPPQINGVTFDYTHQEIQDIVDNINEQIIDDYENPKIEETGDEIDDMIWDGTSFHLEDDADDITPVPIPNPEEEEDEEEDETGETPPSPPSIYQIRKAVSNFTIPQGTILQNDIGMEYVLLETVTIPKGQYTATGTIKAKQSGTRYNTPKETIKKFKNNQLSSELLCVNREDIKGGTDGETDDEYRHRLLNNISTNISVNYLKRQGVIIYTKKELRNSVRTKMTSFNPYLNNKYVAIPPLNEVEDFVNNELIADYCMIIYKKGW